MGVIVAPPGSGKTIVGLSIIAQKKQPVLIIVHRRQLLGQWIQRIQSFLGSTTINFIYDGFLFFLRILRLFETDTTEEDIATKNAKNNTRLC